MLPREEWLVRVRALICGGVDGAGRDGGGETVWRRGGWRALFSP